MTSLQFSSNPKSIIIPKSNPSNKILTPIPASSHNDYIDNMTNQENMSSLSEDNDLDIYLEDHPSSGRSFYIKGEGTKAIKTDLKNRYGNAIRWISSAGGWNLSNKHREDVESFIKSIKENNHNMIEDSNGIPTVSQPSKSKSRYVNCSCKIYLPEASMLVNLKIDPSKKFPQGKKLQYIVNKVEPYKKFYVVWSYNENDGPEGAMIKLVITNGEWKIWGMPDEHSIKFTE